MHNSVLLQRGGCLVALPTNDEVIPTRADGQWYWPQSAVVTGHRLLVFCGRVERSAPGAFGFRTTGVEIAVFDLTGPMPRFERLVPTPSTDAPEEQLQYGAANVRDNGWLYVWGSRHTTGAFGRAVGVARVPTATVLDRRTWRFWDGSRWSRRASDAAVVAHRWSTAFSVWRDRGRLRSLTKEDDVYGHAVVLGKATSPTRPFTRRAVLDAPSNRVFLHYNALAHPEIRLPGGLLLVTVCRNSTDLTRVLADHDLYKPQFFTAPAA